MKGTLLSLQVGKVKKFTMPPGLRVDFRHANWTSGIYKSPTPGPVQITKNHIAGDEQADLRFHGGPDNVVLAYASEHYPAWRDEFESELPFGSFGENFTTLGFTEET